MRTATIAWPSGNQPRSTVRRVPRLLAALAGCWLASAAAHLHAQVPPAASQPLAYPAWPADTTSADVRPLPPLSAVPAEGTFAPSLPQSQQPQPRQGWASAEVVPPTLQQPHWLESLPNTEGSPYQPTAFFDPNIDVTVPSVADPPLEMPLTFDEDYEPILPPPKPRSLGPYQQSLFTTTYVGGNELGLTTLDMRSVFAFPLPNEDSPLILTPGYGWTLTEGPNYTDVPSQLHEAYLDIRYLKRFTPAFLIDLGVTPGLYSDFEGSHRDAFRLGARGLVALTYSPTVQIVAGVAYLDRDDVEFLPLGGIVWTPSDETRLELVSPRPRFLKRFWKKDYREAWWYVAGEFGGGSWAIARKCGCSDVLNYYDARAVLGVELKNEQGPGALFEAGYVFNRHLEYLSGGPTFEPDDTFVFRAGLTF